MEINTAIKNRRSIRKFKKRTISDRVIKKLIEAAGNAPSFHNLQPWHFIVLSGKTKEDLLRLLDKRKTRKDQTLYVRMILKPSIEIIRNAPSVILVYARDMLKFKKKFTDLEKVVGEKLSGLNNLTRNADLWAIQSTACAVQNLFLTAHSMGIGSVWIGVVTTQKKAINKLLNLDGDFQGILALGYPDEKPKKTPKYPVSMILSYRD